jgi:putative phosphoribosyl transferase
MPFELFADRVDAGIKLSKALPHYKNCKDLFIFGLPRGGIPVAFEVAKFLKAPLDALLVKKSGIPGQEELAFGAIAMGGVTFLNDELINQIGLSNDAIEQIKEEKKKLLDKKNKLYRDNAPIPNLKNKTVILIDDDIATGATIKAAVSA